MVVTDSRKAAVRYKLALDKYVGQQEYRDIVAMVAFSGDVEDKESGPEPFNERNMNPGLKGRDLRDAFDTDEYQVMIVANKFQTGFDQPKLCAMYVDKKLNGVDCVQTLSRLNRTYPGKEDPFVLDFVNKPEDVLASFKPYYRTAELESVADPNQIYDMQEKLQQERIFTWQEVESFAEAFFDPKQTQDKLSYFTRPAVDRYKARYSSAMEAIRDAQRSEREAEMQGDDVALSNARRAAKAAGEEKGVLDVFRKDLGSFVRFYEFISQIVPLDDRDLELLGVYARHLRPLLCPEVLYEDIDLSGVELTHYRLKKQQEHRLNLNDGEGDYRLSGVVETGSGTGHDPEKEALAEIIARLNELFGAEQWTDKDRLNYLNTVKDKVMENSAVAAQIEANDSPEQVMLGDFPAAVQEAVMDSLDTHTAIAESVLREDSIRQAFARLVLDAVLYHKQPPSSSL